MIRPTCLDTETIVAFVGGRLGAPGRDALAAHVAACDACGERLAVAVAGFQGGEAPANRQSESSLRPPTFPRGATIGRYVVLGMAGRGGMGEVYAAYDPELDRRIALKVFRGPPDERRRRRLQREAKAIAKVRHPNVVVVHDAGVSGDHGFLAMEYVEGVTLGRWLADGRRSSSDIIDLFMAAGRGLAAAHAAGLVHRDFKPNNVMVSTDGTARVLDFGLVRSVASALEGEGVVEVSAETARPVFRGTTTTAAAGTPIYMAPEQFLDRPADARSDQFSFCVAFYEALYGTRPFAGDDLGELRESVCAGRVEPAAAGVHIASRVRGILLRGLRTRPEERWPSMNHLLSALARKPVRGRRLLVKASGLLVLAAAGWWWTGREGRLDRMCRGGPERWGGVWEVAGPSGQPAPRRTAVYQAFKRTGLPGFLENWQRVARALDAYAAGWVRIYTEACQATHVRGEQSPEALDLRMSCLSDHLVRVQGAVEVFSQATPDIVAQAGATVDRLPSLDDCSDLALLKARVRPPADRQTRERVARLNRELARVEALSSSTRCEEVVGAWRTLCAQARETGYPPLEARSLLAIGTHEACLDPQEHSTATLRAAHLALAAGDDEAAATAILFYVVDLGNQGTPIAETANWLDLVDATMARLPHRPPALEAWRLNIRAYSLGRAGDEKGSADAFVQAIELLERTQGVGHLDYGIALLSRGLTLHEERRDAEALDLYLRAHELFTKTVGPQSTHAALSLADAGEALVALGRHEEARAALEEALTVFRQSGAANYVKGFVLTVEGQALMAKGRQAEAAAVWEEALGLSGEQLTPYRLQALFGLARALPADAPSHRRALALARAALDGYIAVRDVGEATRVESWIRSGRRQHRTAK